MVYNSDKLALFSVYMSIFGSSLQYAIVFPISSEMVRKLGGVESRSNTGLWAGILASSIMIAQAIAYPLLGVLSDRFGRRPMLLIGTLWVGVLSCLFGMSYNLWMAIALRFAQGLFSCISGVSKTIISELRPGPRQAQAMSWLVLFMVMAFVLGLVFGGLLCEPDLTNSEFLSQHPFLLPCLVPSFFLFIGFLAALFFLKETLNKDPAVPGRVQRRWKDIIIDKNVIKVQVLYFLTTFLDTTTMEVFILWCYANKEDGGFELDPFGIGLVLSISYALFAPFQKMYYDFLAKKLTLKKLVKVHALARIVIYAATPLASLLRYHNILGKAALVVCYTLFQSMAFPMLTSMYILTNNCAVSEERGRVNGVSMTVGSSGRGIGPLLFGYIFAQTTQSGLPFPLNFAFSYECLTLILIGYLFLLNTLPDSLNYPKQDRTSNLLSDED